MDAFSVVLCWARRRARLSSYAVISSGVRVMAVGARRSIGLGISGERDCRRCIGDEGGSAPGEVGVGEGPCEGLLRASKKIASQSKVNIPIHDSVQLFLCI